MSRTLVAYFSASGVTKKVAEELAKVEGADLFAIQPETPYTAADLDYTNKQSRSSREMQDKNCRPPLTEDTVNMTQYDTVFLGYPIWWGREPSVVDTFLTSYDFSGKRIVPFCTSGGSGFGSKTRIQELAPGALVEDGRRLGGTVSEADLKLWTDGLGL